MTHQRVDIGSVCWDWLPIRTADTETPIPTKTKFLPPPPPFFPWLTFIVVRWTESSKIEEQISRNAEPTQPTVLQKSTSTNNSSHGRNV